MSNVHKLGRICSVCECPIIDRSKSGCCNKHRDRTGKNNSFYGRKHKPETVAQMKIATAIASKELWKDSSYREKVIKGISKPRRESFKEEQSVRIKQWYCDNPEQRNIRSHKMARSWKEGKISVDSDGFSSNESKLEKDLFEALCLECNIVKKSVFVDDGHTFMPDMIALNEGVVIEFFGDYWHANPKKYTSDDNIRGKLVQEIWDRDEKRIKQLEGLGYQVQVVWESEFKDDPEYIVKRISTYLNWESCSF